MTRTGSNRLRGSRLTPSEPTAMKKNVVKFSVNILLFWDLCSIAVIGFLLAFIVPEGRAGRGAKVFWGLHRHEWGTIHLYLSVLLLFLLIIHIRFNWAWIVQSAKRYFGDQWKASLWCVSGGWIPVLVIAYVVTKQFAGP